MCIMKLAEFMRGAEGGAAGPPAVSRLARLPRARPREPQKRVRLGANIPIH